MVELSVNGNVGLGGLEAGLSSDFTGNTEGLGDVTGAGVGADAASPSVEKTKITKIHSYHKRAIRYFEIVVLESEPKSNYLLYL